jgi:hypothetical protein
MTVSLYYGESFYTVVSYVGLLLVLDSGFGCFPASGDPAIINRIIVKDEGMNMVVTGR